MLKNNVVTNYLILKLIHRHTSLTRYSIMIKFRQLGFRPSTHQTYTAVDKLLERKLVKFSIVDVPFTKYSGGSRPHTNSKKLYTLTSEGAKELIDLEFKLRIILLAQIDGKKI